jgi:hypothetical protein
MHGEIAAIHFDLEPNPIRQPEHEIGPEKAIDTAQLRIALDRKFDTVIKFAADDPGRVGGIGNGLDADPQLGVGRVGKRTQADVAMGIYHPDPLPILEFQCKVQLVQAAAGGRFRLLGNSDGSAQGKRKGNNDQRR